MEKTEKVLKILGFAYRARKLTIGMSATVGSIKSRKAHAVILASDVSDNAGSKIRSAAETIGLPVHRIGTKDDFGRLFGRGDVAIIGVTGRTFAKSVSEILNQRT